MPHRKGCYSKVDDDSDSEEIPSHRTLNKMKVDMLRSIRIILILILLMMILSLGLLATLMIMMAPMLDPLIQSAKNAHTITDKAVAFSTSPFLTEALESISQVSQQLPSINQFIKPIMAINTSAIIAQGNAAINVFRPIMTINTSAIIDQGMVAMKAAGGLIDDIVDVDPKAMITYLKDRQLLERVMRLLEGANALLDRVENPETQQTIDRVSVDASMLLGFAKSLITEFNSTGLTVKIH